MISLFLRNLLFTILQPGIVAGLIPYWIIGRDIHTTFAQPLNYIHYTGIAIFSAGVIILLTCIVRFAIDGKGTLSPADPTKRLVVKGLYKWSRNPMYIGVIMALLGEAIFFQSLSLCLYLLLVFFAFTIFIRVHEEPRLRKDFGDEYIRYCQKVRRWI